jgi:putative membrane protein
MPFSSIPADRPHRLASAAGAGALLVAFVGPLDAAAHTNLTAHMAQHVILLAVAAPLLAVGLGPSLPALPHSGGGMGWLAWTGVAVTLQTAVMWAWHAPWLFQSALRNPPVHVVEHAMFLGSAFLFWWAVAAGRQARLGAAVLVVFLAAMPGTALGALLTLASHPWYPAYAHESARAALADQQLAGVVMWAFGGFAYVIAAAALFAVWMRGLEGALPGRTFARITLPTETVP